MSDFEHYATVGHSPALVRLSVAEAQELAALVAKNLRTAARQSRSTKVFVSGGGGFGARRGARVFAYGVIVSFIALFLMPTIAVIGYYGIVASDQFATETRFALKAGESSILDSLSGIAGLPSSQQTQDSLVIVAYIKSRSMVERLDAEFDLCKIYSRPDADFLARFRAGETIEDLVKYWNRRIDVGVETQSGIISLEVRAFTPEDSLRLSRRIVVLAEELVNQLSERARGNALRQSKDELERAQQTLSRASAAMRGARNAEGVLDVKLAAEASSKVLVAMKTELITKEQEYAVKAPMIAKDAPQMRILKAQIDNLNEQINALNAEMTDSEKGNAISRLGTSAETTRTADGAGKRSLAGSISVLDRYQVDLDLAQRQYASAAIAFESARADTVTQHAYVNTFSPSALAEDALYPKRLWNSSLIIMGDLFLWLILLGFSFLIRDYMTA